MPTKLVLKLKLTAAQVRASVRLSRVAQQKAAIETAATIETELHQARESELQEAFAKPVAPRHVSAVGGKSERVSSNVAEERESCSGMEEEEEEEGASQSEGGSKLVWQSNH